MRCGSTSGSETTGNGTGARETCRLAGDALPADTPCVGYCCALEQHKNELAEGELESRTQGECVGDPVGSCNRGCSERGGRQDDGPVGSRERGSGCGIGEPVGTAAGGEAMKLPRYRCHKEVSAVRILELRARSDGGATIIPDAPGLAPLIVSPVYLKKHEPRAGGYYVRYDDGYESFTPPQPFEAGYTRISSSSEDLPFNE